LRPGIALERLESASHAIVERREGDTVVVATKRPTIEADRDFLLAWSPRLNGLPQPSILVEERDGRRFAMLMLFPPTPGSEAGLGLATETLFVVDVSGSMDGPSIRQARTALAAALDRLRPDDRFDILEFNDTSDLFRPGFEYADAATIEQAHAWVRGLEAGGGTMILPALERALELMSRSGSSRSQRIVFVTDGAVANEDEVFRTISEKLGRSRLHTIGIGHAPNRYLMRKMARFGRGLCHFVTGAAGSRNEIDAFFERLDRPVMTDLALEWAGLPRDGVYPARLPDLHSGEPLVLLARIEDGAERAPVRLSGYTRNGPVETSALPGATSLHGAGIGVRWARARVDELMDSLHEGADPDDVRAEVVDVALEFDLVTRYTSLVAVELTPTALGPARTLGLAATLPQGGTDGPARTILGLALAGSGLLLLILGRR